MDSIGFWITPLLLLPGVGMLVTSTANRYQRLHDELHGLMDADGSLGADFARILSRRAGLFRGTLVALYASVSCLSLAGLTGVVAESFALASTVQAVAVSLTAIAVAALLAASLMLVLETRLSIHVFRAHLGE